jgi:DNA-binding transcriptional LysR family regulator
VTRSIRAFREAFPLVAITLEEALSDQVFERMRTDRMDVAFIRTSVADADVFVVSPLLEEAMLAALPSGHPLAQGDNALLLQHLGGETFILYGPPGTGIYDRTVAACRAAGFSPRIGQQAPRVTSTLGLVAAGLGISLVPVCMQGMNVDGVSYHRLKGSALPTAVLNLASRRGDASPVVRLFLDLVKKTAKNILAAERRQVRRSTSPGKGG